MPIYRYNNKTYDVPESDMWKFEKHTPGAKLDLYDEDGNEYSVPVSDIKKFKRNVKDWRYDKPSVKVETPIKTESVVESPVSEEEEDTATTQGTSAGSRVETPVENANVVKSEVFEENDSVVPVAHEATDEVQTSTPKKADIPLVLSADVRNAVKAEEHQAMHPSMINMGNDETPIYKVDYGTREENTEGAQAIEKKRLPKEIAELEGKLAKGNLASQTRLSLQTQLGKKKERLDWLYEGEEEQLRNDIADSLGDLKGEFEEMYKEESEKSKARLNFPKHNAPANPMAMSSYVDLGEIKTFAPASRAKHNMDRITDVIAEYNRVKSGGNWLVGAAKGLQTANFRQWDYGLVSGPEEMALSEAMRKHDAGEKLTKAEEVLLDTEAMRIAVEQAYKVDWSESGFGAGQITAESLPFMAQMMANPASGLGKGLTKGSLGLLSRYAARHLTRNAPKMAQKAAVKTATAGTRLIGDVAGATVMTGTTGAPAVLTDAERRAHGDVQYGADYRYGGHTKGDSYADALRKSAVATTIDNFTGIFPLVEGATDFVGKGLKHIAPKKVAAAIDRTLSSDFAKGVDNFAQKTQWHGPIEEYLEEVEAGLLNMALVGDEEWDEFWTVDKQMETFLGVALMGGSISAMKTLGYRSEATVARKDADKLNTRMHNALGADWDALEQDLRNPDRASQVLADMRVLGYDTNIMEAAVQYAQLRAKQEGAELAEMKLAETNPTVAQAHTAYDSGEAAVEIDQKAQVETDFESADASMREIFDENDMALLEGEDFIEVANQFIERGADAEVVGNYINARSAHEGMLDRLQTEIDALTEGVDAEVDQVTNRETGNVQGVKMKDGSYAHVVTGQVALREDGSIDKQNSSNSLVIYQDGKLSFTNPSLIEEASAPVSAEEHKQQKKSEIETAYLEQTEQGINDVKRQREADETIETHGTAMIRANENGGLIEVEVSPGYEEGKVIVIGAKDVLGANVVEIPMDQYQQLYVGRPQTLVDGGRDSVAPNATETDATETAAPQAAASAPTAEVSLQTNTPAAEETLQPTSETQSVSPKSRIPVGENGELLYEKAEADDAWDSLLEDTDGDAEMAQTVANRMVEQKKANLKTVQGKKAKNAQNVTDIIAAEKARKAEIVQAQQELEAWEKIAGTMKRRQDAVKAEELRRAQEAEAQRKVEAQQKAAEKAEALRQEREALHGVPDMTDDTPQDARARGYRRVNGNKVDRQAPLNGVAGKDVEVKFTNGVMPQGRVMVIEANELQPSHTQGQRNAKHFIDEAQPKERKDAASKIASQKIAENIRPEEITTSVTAYTGAPTTNNRGEVIQGNSRSDALKQMWDSYPEQAAKYKKYLIEHAEELGLDAEAVAQMERPVLVNMLDVADNEAITLGQYVAQDTESGGVERIKAKNVLQKMGDDVRNFANRLLQSVDEETSFAGLIDANGADVIQWMAQKGYITPTQQQSAYDGKGNLTAEAKNDLRSIMYQSIFKDGNTLLEEMFNALPVKAQKAILATAYRDFDSPAEERMIEEVQSSIKAFYVLLQDPAFASAKNITDARAAVEAWKNQYQMDDVTGESYLPSDKFSNFALHLATMYKGENQSVIQGTFNKMFDLIQGIAEPDLFNMNPDTTPRTLVAAIKETLNIDYNGQHGSDLLASGTTASQGRQQGSDGNAASGKQNQNGQGTDDGRRRTEGDSGRSRNDEEREDDLQEVEALAQTAPQTAGLAPSEKARVVREHKAKIAQAEAEATQWENIANTLGQAEQIANQSTNLVEQTAPAQAPQGEASVAPSAQTQEGQSQSNQEQTEQELYAEEQAKKLAEHREWVAQVSEVAARMAERWGRLLNVNVRVHTDASTIVNREAAERINRGDVVDGWYEPSTNEVHVYVPGVVTRGMMDGVNPIDRLAMTIRHEVVAHKGLREILGKDAYQETMLHVWNGMTESERKEWLAYVNGDANNASDQIAAADEMCAHIAELVEPSTREKTLFERLVQAVVDFFKKGDMPTMTEEIRDLLRANYAYMREATDANKQAVLEQAEKLKQSADQRAVENVSAKGEAEVQKSSKVEESSAEPRSGAFGTIYTQFKGNAKEAIAFLLEKKEGEAVAALHHPEIGDIDLVWGKEGTGKSDGFGLAKLAKYHPEVLDNLQEILNDMRVTARSANRVQLESETHQAAVRLTWDNENKNWLLTAFEKKNSVSDNTTDTDETSNGGKRNDTATPQNTVSDSKGTDNLSEGQKNAGENVSGGVNELIAQAESETDVTPTEGQKKAGNYKKGKVKVAGYEISIEQPKGSVRSGVDANGNAWEQTMHNTYGYFLGTEGVDGDHIDVFLANDMDAWNGEQVFVVDQYNEDGSFDEHKVMLGFNSIEDAQSAYLSNYEDGWADKHNIVVTGTSASDFKKWVDSSHRKTKAFADYKNVKKNEGQNGANNSGRDGVASDGTKDNVALDGVVEGKIYKNNLAGGKAVAVVRGKSGGQVLVAYASDMEDAQNGLFMGEELVSDVEMAERLDRGEFAELENVKKSGRENAVAEATDFLRSQGANVDEQRGDVRFSAAYTPKGEAKEKFIADVMAVTGRSRADVESYLKAEESLTAFIYNEQNAPFLDYRADDRYTAIKENSDYPQGTVDFNNICRKRASFTTIYDRLQREFPMHVFTENDLAKIREVMKKNGMEVACGLCYLEDRRQLMGEIAESFIEELKGGFKDYASKSPAKAKVAEKIKNQIGEDTYIPDIADLITLAGSTELHKSHPNIYEAFNIFNNARGQQSANLFQGYAEYKREILKWSDAKVKKANDNGGLRIFSYSDFEAHHLIDIVQIINDCAARGVKIQGYTKVPAVAKVLANTNVKLNRSLIPLGDTGIKDGKLAYDPIEGIDINDKDFFESNDNIGNVLVGCNDEQIRMAMADDFVHYIIPFHTNQKQELVEAKGCGKWTNYKYEQREYKDGKAAEKGVNIYTDVLNAAEKEGNPITNEREFTERFLNVCKERGLTPRFARFLNTDANGEYTYTPGYYKLLLDFKMFDANGNILPQNPIEANFDNQLNQEILADYVKGENAKLEEGHDAKIDKVFAEVKSALGLTPMFSAKEGTNMSPADMLERMGNEDIDAVNARFNAELDGFTEYNADSVVFNLGAPSNILQAAGVVNKNMKLYGSKVAMKMKKHGFEASELRDLPKAIANPIAVFNNYNKDGNRSILTELHTAQGNFLVTLSVGKGQDIDFNIVSSVFGKGENNIINWLNNGYATYINKAKALNYLHLATPIVAASNNQELVSATNVVESFENPQILGQENDGDTLFSYKPVGGNSGYVGYSMSKRAQQAREEGRFPKTDFKKEYGVTEKVLDGLVKAGVVDNSEWHHTSSYGNKTPFYGWVDEAYADVYAENKKAVKQILDGKDVDGNVFAELPTENPYTEMSAPIPEGWYPFLNNLDDNLTEAERESALMERFGDAYAKLKDASENNRKYYEYEANKGRMEREFYAKVGERLKDFFEEKVATASQLTETVGDDAILEEGAATMSQRSGQTMFSFAKSPEEFDAVQREAVRQKGIVAPNLNNIVLDIVDIDRHDFAGTGKEAIETAKEWANKNIVGEHTAKAGTSEEFAYTIDEKSIKKYLSSIATQKSDNLGVHLSVLKRLPYVINNSVEAEIHADYKKIDGRDSANGINDYNLLIHRLYGCARINNELHRVKTTLKEKKSDGIKPYSYEVTKIELLSGSSQNGTSSSDALNNSIDGAKLLENVEKSYDPGVKLLDASEKTREGDGQDVTRFSSRPIIGDKKLFEGLRELGEGEMSAVERVFTESKSFEFTSKNKIESYDDVAYIFKQLENESVENTFVVLVKKGKPTVVHLAMGHFTQSFVNRSAIHAAVTRVQPDKIYFVHNHPSGVLKSSPQDRAILTQLYRTYGEKVQDGVIINTYSGEYGVFDIMYDDSRRMPQQIEGERPIKVYSFSKQVYNNDFRPTSKMDTAEAIAGFITSHRLGDREKLGLIVLNNGLGIVGNVFLPYTEVTSDNVKSVGKDIAYHAAVMGGTRAILYGNGALESIANKGLSEAVRESTEGEIPLLDYLHIEGGNAKSASREGVRFSVAPNASPTERLRSALAPMGIEVKESDVPTFTKWSSEENCLLVNPERIENYDTLVGFAVYDIAKNKGFAVALGGTEKAEAFIDDVIADVFADLEGDADFAEAVRDAGYDVREAVKIYLSHIRDYVPEFEESGIGMYLSNRLSAALSETYGDVQIFARFADMILGSLSGRYDQGVVDVMQRVAARWEAEHRSPQSSGGDGSVPPSDGNKITKSKAQRALRESREQRSARVIYEENVKILGAQFYLHGLTKAIWNALKSKSGEKLATLKDNMKRLGNEWIEVVLDRTNAVRQLQLAIEKAGGEVLQSFEDVWRTLGALSSKNYAEMQEVQRKLVKPLAEVYASIQKRHGYTHDEIEKYLYCKHALERNVVMGQRKYEEELERGYERVKQLHAEDAQNLTKREFKARYAEELAKVEEKAKKALSKDYSGLKELLKNDVTSNRYTALMAAAQKVVADFESKVEPFNVNKLWDKMKALSDFALKKEFDCGLISRELYNDVREMYQNYVPLRGWENDAAGNFYHYNTDIDVFEGMQRAFKRAYGRTSQAKDIMGHMIAMANTAIMCGNKNMAKQKFLFLAENHPNDVMLVSDVWYHRTPDGSISAVTPNIHPSMTPEEVAETLADFEAQMKAEETAGNAKRYKSDFGKEIGLHMTTFQEKQHGVRVMINGKEKMVWIVGDPRAAMVLNGSLSDRNEIGIIRSFFNKLMRFQNASNTSMNLNFLLGNVQRDFQTALNSAFINKGTKYAEKFSKNYGKVMGGAMGSLIGGGVGGVVGGGLLGTAVGSVAGGAVSGTLSKVKGAGAFPIVDLMRRYDKGELDMNNEMDKAFYDFAMNGGITGITSMLTAEDAQDTFESQVDDINGGLLRGTKNVVKGVFNNIELTNNAFENATRFATFLTSREMGSSMTEAIMDAKEHSVNFNMRGTGSWFDVKYLLTCIAFANASLQALRLNLEWWGHSKSKTIASFLGYVAMGIANAVVMSLLFGDDDDDDKVNDEWYGLSRFNRYNNFNVLTGDGSVKVSIPHEFRAPFAIGNMIVDAYNGKISQRDAIAEILAMPGNYSPVGLIGPGTDITDVNDVIFTFIGELVPTVVAKDIYDLVRNENFLGSPIHNIRDYNEDLPEFQRAGKRTFPIFVEFSKTMNDLAGGAYNRRSGGENYANNPSVLQYLLEQRVGGGLMMWVNAGRAVYDAFDPKSEVDVHDIPFAKAVWAKGGKDNVFQTMVWNDFKVMDDAFNLVDKELKRNAKTKELSIDYRLTRLAEMEQDGELAEYFTFYPYAKKDEEYQKLINAAQKDGDDDEVKRLRQEQLAFRTYALGHMKDATSTDVELQTKVERTRATVQPYIEQMRKLESAWNIAYEKDDAEKKNALESEIEVLESDTTMLRNAELFKDYESDQRDWIKAKNNGDTEDAEESWEYMMNIARLLD